MAMWDLSRFLSFQFTQITYYHVLPLQESSLLLSSLYPVSCSKICLSFNNPFILSSFIPQLVFLCVFSTHDLVIFILIFWTSISESTSINCLFCPTHVDDATAFFFFFSAIFIIIITNLLFATQLWSWWKLWLDEVFSFPTQFGRVEFKHSYALKKCPNHAYVESHPLLPHQVHAIINAQFLHNTATVWNQVVKMNVWFV